MIKEWEINLNLMKTTKEINIFSQIFAQFSWSYRYILPNLQGTDHLYLIQVSPKNVENEIKQCNSFSKSNIIKL